MRYMIISVLIWGGLAAQTPQPLHGTISNLSAEPAPYVPDDSLSYAADVPRMPAVVVVVPGAFFLMARPALAPVYYGTAYGTPRFLGHPGASRGHSLVPITRGRGAVRGGRR